ncbi:MAG: 2-C-methyl-D-erythritol 4-phosphate cytidylyltransferase [Deltaproteobacteria bacterium]|nr:2-C-methyl-D-erythritol 4-phosphate cytidylyltransferase [Deltaproteobacteria bacterium]
MNCAVIVAGGSGVRMGADVPKQYLPLLGVPILARTLAAFARCPDIHQVVLVAPEPDFDRITGNILPLVETGVAVRMAPGGSRRQESVYHGLLAARDLEAEIVAIHDAVRPLVSPGDISRCIETAKTRGACLLAAPATDTLKRADENLLVTQTLDRTNVWLAQTPQAFVLSLILKAHQTALEQGITATDDAALAEHAGHPVTIVPSTPKNLKITTPQDLVIAEALLRAEEA